jgi:hypothetical protein
VIRIDEVLPLVGLVFFACAKTVPEQPFLPRYDEQASISQAGDTEWDGGWHAEHNLTLACAINGNNFLPLACPRWKTTGGPRANAKTHRIRGPSTGLASLVVKLESLAPFRVSS